MPRGAAQAYQRRGEVAQVLALVGAAPPACRHFLQHRHHLGRLALHEQVLGQVAQRRVQLVGVAPGAQQGHVLLHQRLAFGRAPGGFEKEGARQQPLRLRRRRECRVERRLGFAQRGGRGRVVVAPDKLLGRGDQRGEAAQAVARLAPQPGGARERGQLGLGVLLVCERRPALQQPCFHLWWRAGVDAVEGQLAPAQAFGHEADALPQPGAAASQRHQRAAAPRVVRGFGGPGQGGTQVVQLGGELRFELVGALGPAACIELVQQGHHGAGVAFADDDGLARRGQPVQREGARALQQPVAWHAARVDADERLVGQRAQRFQQRPLVVTRLAHHRWQQPQAEATREHAQPAQHALLVGVQQGVAPFERGRQRLLALRGAAPATAEHAQPCVGARGIAGRLFQPLAQPGDAQQRHPRRGQLDRERDSVELAADFSGVGARAGVELEGRLQAAHPLGEQVHGIACGGGFGRGHHLVAVHRQWPEPPHPLGSQAQRLLAGGQQVQRGGRVEQRLRQRGHSGHEVLAVVEHQQQRLAGAAAGQPLGQLRLPLGGGVGLQWHRDRAGDGGHQQPRIGQRRQLDPGRAAAEEAAVDRGVRRRQREPSLADAPRARHREQALAWQGECQLGEVGVATEQRAIGRW